MKVFSFLYKGLKGAIKYGALVMAFLKAFEVLKEELEKLDTVNTDDSKT